MNRWRWLILLLVITAAGGAYGFWRSNHPMVENARSIVSSHLGLPRRFPGKSVEERLQGTGFALGDPILLRIFKQERKLEIWRGKRGRFQLALNYDICQWSGTLGPKLREGDGQSPEGFYFASARQLNPNSSYHRAINIGFPNNYDQAQGRTGSFLMIHGACVSIGCYAMTDSGIDDIYRLVEAALKSGQKSIPIHIFPFRLTAENLAAHKESAWAAFWNNLAEGDRLFLKSGEAPQVSVCGGRYRFGKPEASCQVVMPW